MRIGCSHKPMGPGTRKPENKARVLHLLASFDPNVPPKLAGHACKEMLA